MYDGSLFAEVSENEFVREREEPPVKSDNLTNTERHLTDGTR